MNMAGGHVIMLTTHLSGRNGCGHHWADSGQHQRGAKLIVYHMHANYQNKYPSTVYTSETGVI